MHRTIKLSSYYNSLLLHITSQSKDICDRIRFDTKHSVTQLRTNQYLRVSEVR